MSVQSIKPNISSPVKTVVKTAKIAAGATLAAGTVLYMAQTGKLNPSQNGNRAVELVKSVLKKPADMFLTSSKGNPNLSAISDKVYSTGKFLTEKYQQIKPAFDKKVDTLVDFVKSKFTKEPKNFQ